MKKHSYVFIVLLLMAFFVIGCTGSLKVNRQDGEFPSSVVAQNGWLAVKGRFLVNEKGKKLVLKGVSYSWHNWRPRFYNASTVKFLQKEWKCTLVRAAMGVEPTGAYIENPQFASDCITKVVDAAIQSGIYVIIDWHSHHIYTEEAKAFFAQMAAKYKDVPNIIYEIFNEPVDDSWEALKAYSEEIIKTIRAEGAQSVILVGTSHWDQDIHLPADNPITGYNNIMYTLHFYAAAHKQELRDRADYVLNKNLPIFVSECAGMEANGDGAIHYEEWGIWLEWMKKNSISWAAWSISDKDETCSMIQTTGASEGGWKDSDLKRWGIIVKKELSN
ncbi:Endoglucanase [termite gut metagenome]|uniref:Endoglucanase n=1 Tax=termite gut metagenome TaxID=433724 RepID=A0A5J4RYY7_9ZZZZ